MTPHDIWSTPWWVTLILQQNYHKQHPEKTIRIIVINSAYSWYCHASQLWDRWHYWCMLAARSQCWTMHSPPKLLKTLCCVFILGFLSLFVVLNLVRIGSSLASMGKWLGHIPSRDGMSGRASTKFWGTMPSVSCSGPPLQMRGLSGTCLYCSKCVLDTHALHPLHVLKVSPFHSLS